MCKVKKFLFRRFAQKLALNLPKGCIILYTTYASTACPLDIAKAIRLVDTEISSFVLDCYRKGSGIDSCWGHDNLS